MNTSLNAGSAKIYEFPVRARTNVGGRRDESKSTADLMSPRVPQAVFGSGYYHEAAIQEAEQARKR